MLEHVVDPVEDQLWRDNLGEMSATIRMRV